MFRHLFVLALSINCLSAHAHDLTRLPLGDNLKSTAPEKGKLWPCLIDPAAGGAFKDGAWINKTTGTFDKTAKPIVLGDVAWPHQFSVSVVNQRRLFISNGLPDHGTGVFPIGFETEAYKIDRNPNWIKTQTINFTLPAKPQLAPRTSCAPGAVGILLSGVSLFSALDAPGRDAVAHEVQDKCDGHPQETGVYHYHSASPCLPDKRETDGRSSLIGYAIDGFGIYGSYAVAGKKLESKDLDECHGISSEVMWDGKRVAMYHYVATDDFPYTVGCIRGVFERATVETISGPRPGWFQ